MKILALESSAVSASVALTDGEKLIAQSFQNCGLTHGGKPAGKWRHPPQRN